MHASKNPLIGVDRSSKVETNDTSKSLEEKQEGKEVYLVLKPLGHIRLSQEIRISQTNFTVGRKSKNNLPIQDKRLSGIHCMFEA